jgi:hypothetical protein
MVMLKRFFFSGIATFCLAASASADKTETLKGVHLESSKVDSTRTYQGSVIKTFEYPLDSVLKSVMNFSERCNNSYKSRREITDKNYDCKYNNDHIIEAFVIKDIQKTGWTKDEGETERFIMGRRIYNRGSFMFYELVQVFEGKNSANHKTVKIVLTMLSDEQVKTYIQPKFQKDSAFNESTSTFILTEVSPKQTDLSYEYKAQTDHWVLNKEISIPQVFSSISKTINDLINNLATESNIQTRDVASF